MGELSLFSRGCWRENNDQPALTPPLRGEAVMRRRVPPPTVIEGCRRRGWPTMYTAVHAAVQPALSACGRFSPQLQRRHRGQQTFVFCELKCLRRFPRTQTPQLSIVKRPVSRLLVCYFWGLRRMKQTGVAYMIFGSGLCLCNIRLVILLEQRRPWPKLNSRYFYFILFFFKDKSNTRL